MELNHLSAKQAFATVAIFYLSTSVLFLLNGLVIGIREPHFLGYVAAFWPAIAAIRGPDIVLVSAGIVAAQTYVRHSGSSPGSVADKAGVGN